MQPLYPPLVLIGILLVGGHWLPTASRFGSHWSVLMPVRVQSSTSPLLGSGEAWRRPLSRKQGITLRGSADIVAELFSFDIGSIVSQRGVCPSETFPRVQKYGLTLLLTTDPALMQALSKVVEQRKDWLFTCSVQKPVVVISIIEDGRSLRGGSLTLSVCTEVTAHPEKRLRKPSRTRCAR